MGFMTGYILGRAGNGKNGTPCYCPETIIEKVNVCNSPSFSDVLGYLAGFLVATAVFAACVSIFVFASETVDGKTQKIFCKIALGFVFAAYVLAVMMIVCNYFGF